MLRECSDEDVSGGDAQVKVEGEDSKEFAVRVGIHQCNVVNPIAAHLCCGDGCGDRRGGKGGTCPDVRR